MTNQIKSFNNRNRELIPERNYSPKLYIRTLHLNQTDGNFVASCPLDNNIVIYGQSPNIENSWFGQNKIISKIGSFGNFSFPNDAKFDFLRGKIWVADTGNKRIVLIDYNTLKAEFEIKNFNFPIAIAVNQIDGDIFVRDFQDIENGIIYWINKNGIIEDKIIFKDQFVNKDFAISKTKLESYSFPSPSMMDFDHARKKLWWVTKDNSYMADFNCMQMSNFNFSNILSDPLTVLSSIEIENKTGNAIIGANPPKGILSNKKFSQIVYMNKNNYNIIYQMNIFDSLLNDNLNIKTQPSSWPNKLEFYNFKNPLMNGIWTLSDNYRGQIKSYLNPNNTLDFSNSNPNGQYGIGTYMYFQGKYQWKFIVYKIKKYPVIDEKWIYMKEKFDSNPFGKYVLKSYYNNDTTKENEYLDDNGLVQLG